MQNNARLQARLRKAVRRLRLIGSAGALVWGLVAAVVLLVFAAWLDLLWELSPAARIALVWGAAAAGAMLLAGPGLPLPPARARPAALARRLDFAANSSGEILTGWELDHSIAGHRARRDEHPRAEHEQDAKASGRSVASDGYHIPHRRAGHDGGRTCRIAGPPRPVGQSRPGQTAGPGVGGLGRTGGCDRTIGPGHARPGQDRVEPFHAADGRRAAL